MSDSITIKLTRTLHDYKKGEVITIDRGIYKREFSTYWKEVNIETLKKPEVKTEEIKDKKETFKKKIKKEVITSKNKKVKVK